MKIKLYSSLILIVLSIILFSCSPMYQILETTSPDTKLENDGFVFENTDVKISFNFWSDGGKVSFFIFNKLDKPIYIDWDKSHLIYNGTSYEYWIDSEDTKSFYAFSNQTSVSSRNRIITLGNNSGIYSSTKIKSKRIIHLPSKSGIYVSKFSISDVPYFTCDFNMKSIMSHSDVKTMNFSDSESPLKFRNYITYSTDEKFDSSRFVDNYFYVSSIHIMNLYAFQGIQNQVEYCSSNGMKTYHIEYPFPYNKPNRFFIENVKNKKVQ